MCGFVGKLYLCGEKPVESDLIQSMMDIIIHRGPDGQGKYVHGPVGLGHCRLSIIDLNTGDQPICNEDKTVWVVYNGEIYNFSELRNDLELRGHKFKSSTDTEVIVHLYEEYGAESVERLRGMFAFALWDERKQTLLLARDRVGIKPLYYINTGKALLFASEIKSLLVDPTVVARINPLGIDRFLTYYYLPGSETLFEGIHKLNPGHYMTVSKGQMVKRQYWDLNFETQPRWTRFNEATKALQELLRRVVKDHMISDVPVGVLLSGGVDSTGVLHYAVEQTNQQIHTFTIGFEDEEFSDERPFAKVVSQHYGTLHQDITMSAKDFHDFLPKYVWHMEEPIFEPPAVALYFISRLARESSVKVLLSGEGGDEAFGGYQNYRNLLLLEYLKSAFGPAKELLRFGLQVIGQAGWKRIGRYKNFIQMPLSQYYFSRTATPDTVFSQLKHSLYKKEFADSLGEEESNMLTRHLCEQNDGISLLNRMLYVDTKTWLPDDLLVKADKMTMATSVELRVPLLDFQVLEFAASLPSRFKVYGWSTKRILKKALKGSVPSEVLKRKKTGLPVPYEKWMKTEMKEFVFDTLLGQNNGLSSYFRRDTLNNLVQMHQRGEGCSQEVFSLLVLELLHEQFVKGSSLPKGVH